MIDDTGNRIVNIDRVVLEDFSENGISSGQGGGVQEVHALHLGGG